MNNFDELMKYLVSIIPDPHAFAKRNKIPPAPLHSAITTGKRIGKFKSNGEERSPTLRNFCLWMDSADIQLMRDDCNNLHDATICRIPTINPSLLQDGTYDITNDQSVLCFSMSWLESIGASNDVVSMIAVENTMQPTIQCGDTLLIDLKQKRMVTNGIFAFAFGGSIVIRRTFATINEIILTTDCTKSEDHIRSFDEVKVIGKVIYSLRRL